MHPTNSGGVRSLPKARPGTGSTFAKLHISDVFSVTCRSSKVWKGRGIVSRGSGE